MWRNHLTVGLRALSRDPLFAAINLFGLRESARTQNILTILEVSGLVLVAVAGLIAVGRTAAQAL